MLVEMSIHCDEIHSMHSHYDIHIKSFQTYDEFLECFCVINLHFYIFFMYLNILELGCTYLSFNILLCILLELKMNIFCLHIYK